MRKILLLSVACLGLVGCEHTETPNYLMRHPNILQREVSNCESQTSNSVYCQMVMNTRSTLINLIQAMQTDPEAFGQTILEAETQAASLKQNVDKAKADLQEAKSKGNKAVIKQAEEKYQTAQIAYENNHDDIEARLAVVGLASPG